MAKLTIRSSGSHLVCRLSTALFKVSEVANYLLLLRSLPRLTFFIFTANVSVSPRKRYLFLLTSVYRGFTEDCDFLEFSACDPFE